MPRKREPNKIHTSPSRAGEMNMQNVDMASDELGIMGNLIEIRNEGKKNKQAYKGLWTTEALVECIDKFFQYCGDNNFKPTIPALTVWLGISKAQFYDWRTQVQKYGDKSEIVNEAVMIMECYLQSNIDKYPTGSIFLLKSSHGHAEVTKVDITTNQSTSLDEVDDLVNRLGLDKPKTE